MRVTILYIKDSLGQWEIERAFCPLYLHDIIVMSCQRNQNSINYIQITITLCKFAQTQTTSKTNMPILQNCPKNQVAMSRKGPLSYFHQYLQPDSGRPMFKFCNTQIRSVLVYFHLMIRHPKWLTETVPQDQKRSISVNNVSHQELVKLVITRLAFQKYFYAMKSYGFFFQEAPVCLPSSCKNERDPVFFMDF